jgi:hypothetical protein
VTSKQSPRCATAATAPAAVTYKGLPISSGGAHALGRMSRRVAYDRTRAFIETCTQPVAPVEYSFTVYTRFELPPVPELEHELRRRFGDYAAIQIAHVGDALSFLDQIDPQPTNRYGMAPIWFRMVSNFRIVDPVTKEPLPGQDPIRFRMFEYQPATPLGTSRLTLTLHNQASLALDLCIPDATESVLRRVVPWLQEHLPCKLSTKHWRAWTPTTSGLYRSRILAPANRASPLRLLK